MSDTERLAALRESIEKLPGFGGWAVRRKDVLGIFDDAFAAGVTLDPQPDTASRFADSSREDLIHRIELLTADLYAEQLRTTPDTASRLRAAAQAMLDKWGKHSGSCCTFDADGRVIVTDESCRCGPVERTLRAALEADHAEAPDAICGAQHPEHPGTTCRRKPGHGGEHATARYDAQMGGRPMTTIRERDAEWAETPPWPLIGKGDTPGRMASDRRDLLAVLDRLVEAAEDYAETITYDTGVALRAAIESAKEVADG